MLKELKPKTPSRRQRTLIDKTQLTKTKILPQLIKGFSRSCGKNNQGKITVRHRGGGHKRLYREITFKREKVEGSILGIEYDPNRSSFIAAVKGTSTNFYILAPAGLSEGDLINSGPGAPISVGNALPLQDIPLGSFIHNISLRPGERGKLIRSAGTSAQLLQKNLQNRGKIRLSSGKQC